MAKKRIKKPDDGSKEAFQRIAGGLEDAINGNIYKASIVDKAKVLVDVTDAVKGKPQSRHDVVFRHLAYNEETNMLAVEAMLLASMIRRLMEEGAVQRVMEDKDIDLALDDGVASLKELALLLMKGKT